MNIYRGRTHTEFYLASLLYDAVEDNDLTSVLSLLTEKHADPNLVLPRTEVSSFHLAVGCGADRHYLDDNVLSDNTDGFDMQCVTAMLLHGSANPNVRTGEGLTPLHVAAAWGRQAIVQLLLRNGANPDITDNCYRTAQMYAELEGHDEIAMLLRTYVRHLEVAILKDRLDEPRPNRQCEMILDKIIVSAGDDVAEYEVTSASSNTNHLDNLPITNVDKYVATWCEEHNQFYRDDAILTADNRHSLDSDGGMGTSRDPSPLQRTLVTIRRPCNENRDILQPKKQPAENGMCKCSNLSRESGIMTLPEDSMDSAKIGRAVRENSGAELTDSFAQLNMARVHSHLESVQTISSDSAASSIVVTPPPDTSSDYFTCPGTNSNSANHSNNPLERNIHQTSSLTRANSASVHCLSINNSDCDNSIIDISDSLENRKSAECAISISDVSESFVSALNKGMLSHDSGASGISAGSSATPLTRRDGSAALSVQEVYKYTDNEHNVLLYEKRLLLPKQSILNEDDARTVSSSKLSSLPGSFDYDIETLRKELSVLGFEPGPITNTTRRVYLRKLYRLKANPHSVANIAENRPKYSNELERTLRHDDWSAADLSLHMIKYRHLDEAVSNQFCTPDSNRRWREGNTKSSFTYLLLDPRVTQNLPARADQMQFAQVWRTFISGIFYVGKGKRSRPYRHLYDALQHWNAGAGTRPNTAEKLQRIVDIWRADSGVICLHVFQNVIPVEAYCREAAMIATLGKDNVTNMKAGEFYGVTSAWNCMEKRQFGVYLLYRAMQIFLSEGERQLCPSDID